MLQFCVFRRIIVMLLCIACMSASFVQRCLPGLAPLAASGASGRAEQRCLFILLCRKPYYGINKNASASTVPVPVECTNMHADNTEGVLTSLTTACKYRTVRRYTSS